MRRISLDKGWQHGVAGHGTAIRPPPVAREVYRQGEGNYYFRSTYLHLIKNI